MSAVISPTALVVFWKRRWIDCVAISVKIAITKFHVYTILAPLLVIQYWPFSLENIHSTRNLSSIGNNSSHSQDFTLIGKSSWDTCNARAHVISISWNFFPRMVRNLISNAREKNPMKFWTKYWREYFRAFMTEFKARIFTATLPFFLPSGRRHTMKHGKLNRVASVV